MGKNDNNGEPLFFAVLASIGTVASLVTLILPGDMFNMKGRILLLLLCIVVIIIGYRKGGWQMIKTLLQILLVLLLLCLVVYIAWWIFGKIMSIKREAEQVSFDVQEEEKDGVAEWIRNKLDKAGARVDLTDVELSTLELEKAARENTVVMPKAEFTDYSCTLAQEGEMQKFRFIAVNDGNYWLEASNMMADTRIDMGLYEYESQIERAKSGDICNQGMILENLKGGNEYEIFIRQRTGSPSFSLKLGWAKPTIDITEYSDFEDSMEFSGQKNQYMYRAEEEGIYRFEFCGIQSEAYMSVRIYNELGKNLP